MIVDMRTVVTAAKLWNTSIHQPVIVIEDSRITSIASRASAEIPSGVRLLEYPRATIAPAFFDVHFHGAAGHDVMEGTPEALDTVGRFLASRGTSTFLATTVTASIDATLRAVEGLAKMIARPAVQGCARPTGIHLEGPFLSHAKRGVHPPAYLLAPDIATFDKLYDASEGHVRLMTVAPELFGASELIAHATARGVRVSVGHSNATAAETRLGIREGAVSATHTFNAMRALDHREPGILGTVLTTDNLFAELICDGIHTAPEMVRLWWSTKGANRGILVTDAMSAAGMPDGEYHLGGFAVQVANGRAMADGVLAGSVLTLDRALVNFVQFTGATVDQGLGLLSANPAQMTGLTDRIGTLAAGHRADLVAVDAEGRLVGSIVGGKPVSPR
jgi:N-acetylglucosamine-6-phosphate deacetylase